jgi:FAD/FMN-containing dehydrogenase
MNAGGAHCFRHGVTGHYVLGVEVLLLDGSIHRFGGPAGGRGDWRADWTRLMVGSEGTLGAFTRFWLRLVPRPEKAWTFRATYPDLVSAERAIQALVMHASFPVAIELMDARCVAMVENSTYAVGLPRDTLLLITEIDGPGALVDRRVSDVETLLKSAGADTVEFSDDEPQRQRLWRARKAAGGLMGQLSPDLVVQDAVIPKGALADVLQLVYDEADAAGIPVVNVFHAGDGNLHPNFLFDSRVPGMLERVEGISKRLMLRVVEIGGALSGEHGIGNDKSAYMPLVFDANALRLQLAVPAVFNPRHQLNPLKVFTSRRFAAESTSAPADRPAALPGRSPQSADKRQFEPFLDVVDGVTCVTADMTSQGLHESLRTYGLRFPLVLDPSATLREQVAASGFAPASSRFGPYCDNITGMNWRLPDGTPVRIGERVVKSTTGYDLLRFLLLSDGQFGEPVDFVLRLRPEGGTTHVVRLAGQDRSVAEGASRLVRTCWMDWLDAVDLVTRADGSSVLRIVVNCPLHEWPVSEAFLSSCAAEWRLSLEVEHPQVPPSDGCPDVVLKTTPDRASALARTVVEAGAALCVTICARGVIHVFLAESGPRAAQAADIGARFGQSLYAVGGDWRSRHLPPEPPRGVEVEWHRLLEGAFASS